MEDLSRHPAILIRESVAITKPLLEDMQSIDDIEPVLLREIIQSSDEDQAARFAAAGHLAGLAYDDDDRLRIIMELQATMASIHDEMVHFACVHALRLMPTCPEVDMALLGIVQMTDEFPLVSALAGSALVQNQQLPPIGWPEVLRQLAECDDERARKIARIALDDLAENNCGPLAFPGRD